MPTLDLQARPEAVPAARRLVRDLLEGWGRQDLRDDVDLVLSELIGNVVLHAPGPVRVLVEQDPDGVLLEVRDTSGVVPVRRGSSGVATTGRGLDLVEALAGRWGVRGRGDGEPGKAVWALVGPVPPGAGAAPDVDVDALLAAYDDEPDLVHVDVGDAPVTLLAEAKDHLDGLLRELALAESAGGLPQEVVEAMTEAARSFAVPRTEIRRLLTAAAERGDERVRLTFDLPVEVAEAGERYLLALSAADSFARDRRMLSLESPVEHRVLREWYVEGLVDGLRGRPAGPTFEARLLRELHSLERDRRTAQAGARLQRVTSQLAGAETVAEIAEVVVREGMAALGAAGGTFTRQRGGRTVPMVETGIDSGVGARYVRSTAGPGPSSQALRTGEPVWIEGRGDRDARFPHLADLQPEASAVAAVPLLVAGEVVGALRFSWRQPRVFAEPERDLLVGLAAQTAQAVARADALADLRDLRDELDRLIGRPGVLAGTDLAVLRTLYEDAPVGIAVHAADGRCLRANTQQAEVWGEAGPGSGPLAAMLDGVLSTGRPLERETTRTGSGGTRSWRTSCFPVRDQDDRLEAAVVLSVEITGQRRAEERHRLLAALGDRLARDPTLTGVLEAVAGAVLPGLGLGVAVHLLDERGRLWPALVRPDGTGAVGDALVAPSGGSDPAALAAEEAGPEGVVRLPLLAAGRTLGLLSVVPRPPHGAGSAPASVLAAGAADDRRVVQDVARRAAAALEGVRAVAASLRLELALDAASIASYDWHVPSGHLDGDDRLFRLLGLDRQSFDGSMATALQRIHPEDVDRLVRESWRVVREGGDLALEYRIALPDGTVRWVSARGRAVTTPAGTERVLGTMIDVTERAEAGLERDRALRRVELVSEIGAALAGTQDVEQALARLTGLLVPALADSASVELPEDRDTGQGPRTVTSGDLPSGPGPALAVPLSAGDRVLGVLRLRRTRPQARAFTGRDAEFAAEVGRRAGLLVDHAAQFAAQRRVAEGLQRSLLPELPVVAGMVLGAAYEPSSSAALVGGDWYDAFVLPDGSLGLVIGDVMGHDIAAAAAMGQLRSVLRTCAVDGDPPGLVLDRLDRLVTSFSMADLATLVYARVDRRPDGSARLTWANAGHPPPLLLGPDGTAEFLTEGASVMVGVPPPDLWGAQPRVQATRSLRPGSTLLMVTDGLVERRGHDLDDRLAELAATAAELRGTTDDPDELCRQLVARMDGGTGTDDAAAVAVTLLRRGPA